MSKLKAVIVEDEIKSIEVLHYLLQRHLGDLVEIIEKFSSSEKALDYLNSHSVDLVFLDIQMPNMDGFELLDRLNEINFDLIFITAFNNYATKAFRYYAVDYLLKPVIAEELVEAVKRVNTKKGIRYDKTDLQKIFDAIEQNDKDISRLAVPTREGVEFLQIADILRLEADGNYTNIFLKSGSRLYTSKTLKVFEGLLPAKLFYRPHQSHIISIDSMRKYIKTDGGYIEMIDGTKISISRNKRADFSQRFY